jgi:tRNA/rRNA methyltransferase
MNVSFILVNPTVPENIGATARAIKTMGFNDLRLVNPCDFMCEKALMLAHGSHNILQNATVYPTLSYAIEDIDFSFATSAKQRWVKQNIIPINDLRSFIETKSKTVNTIALVFGGEESGLSNEDIALCDRITTIPIAAPYPSLNLAQAVMVFAFTLSSVKMDKKKQARKGTSNHGFKPLKEKVGNVLSEIGISNQSLVHGRVLERLTEISDEDVNLIHSVCSKIIESLSEKQRK